MAKAKIVKRKKRIRVEGIATLLLTFGIFSYLGAKFFLQSYNYSLTCKKTEIVEKANSLQQEVAKLESEVNELQNRERVLAVAGEDNIKTNQENVTVVGNEEQ